MTLQLEPFGDKRGKYKRVWTRVLAGFRISLDVRGKNDFSVCYGLQVKHSLTYECAASELGACIMHALAWEGKLGP